MTQKIESISEAFSMQPKFLYVTRVTEMPSEELAKLLIKEINPAVYLLDEKPTSYYEGVNYNNHTIFRYLANSVNVHYYYE